MKGNPIDDLFREKLGSHKITPRANAWSQIDGNLGKKKKGVYFWLSVAASLLIIITAGALYIDQSEIINSGEAQPLEASNKEQEEPFTSKGDNVAPIEQKTDPIKKNTKEVKPAIEFIEPAETQINKLLAESNEETDNAKPQLKSAFGQIIEENSFLIDIDLIRIPKTLSVSTVRNFKQPKVALMDLSRFTTIQDFSEASNKKGFSLMGGIVSLAKSVSKTTETLSDLRAIKNEFVTNELKYGVSTEQEEENPDFKQEK